MHEGEEGHARPGWTTSRRGQDSPWKSQSEWQRTEINGESTPMVWPTLGSRTAKEQNRRYMYRYSAWSVTLYHVYQCGDCEVETENWEWFILTLLLLTYFSDITITKTSWKSIYASTIILTDQCRLLFWQRLYNSGNSLLNSLSSTCYGNMTSSDAKYGIYNPLPSTPDFEIKLHI